MGARYRLTVDPIDRTIDIEEGQTILDACLREGIWLPHACGHGLCSSCKVDLVEGEVDHGRASSFALMDFERDEGKVLACSAMPRSDLRIEADIDLDPDAHCHPVRDYDGRVAAIRDLTPDIKGVWIELQGQAIAFQAGQYVNLHLPGIGTPRAFSLANPPSEDRMVELHVRKVPGGEATGYIHDTLREGDPIRLTGPYGQFFVRRSRRAPILFLAGGSGLSSPKSMILDLLEGGWDLPMTLIHGVRTAADVFMADLFADLAARHANLTYVPALSAPDDRPWSGERGFVHEVAERQFDGRFAGMTAYLCGPPAMIEASVTSLMRGRLFERDIFMERFLSAADTAGSRPRSPLFQKV
ncbi:MAG: 2Fe-2S iron-sulfur cluster binding domain-containing protein [Telmatospirillum sp.]|nr:2Fe-2S iron-sulfur cluster binding domain-containing protein [Telmatospirillum sp.]